MKYYMQFDFRQIPNKGFVVEVSATAPSSPVDGQIYYDTVQQSFLGYENGSWKAIGFNSALGTELTSDNQSKAWSGAALNAFINTNAPVLSVSGKTGVVTLVKADVGLGSVDNTSDAGKPVSTAQQTALNLKANLASPALTGTPTAPTPAAADNSTKIATTAWTQTELSNAIAGAVQGFDGKASVRAKTAANITLSGAQTIDGVSVVAGDRVLVSAQSTATQNGIYVANAGTWVRATDMDAWSEVPGAFVFVEEGTTFADTGWICIADAGGTMGTTSIPWVQFSSAGIVTAGAGLTKSGNVISVANLGITTAMLGDSQVTNLKMADNAVNTVEIVDLAVTTPKIADAAIDISLSGVGAKSTGVLPINRGGTGQTSSAGARGALGVPGKFTAVIPTMSAGSWYSVTHNFNTTVVIAQAWNGGEVIGLNIKELDSNTIQVMADAALATSTDVICIG